MNFFEELRDGLGDIGSTIGDNFWRVVGALAILAVGWWLARLARGWIDRPAVGNLLDRIGLGQPLSDGGYEGPQLLATLVSGLVILAALDLAAEATNIQPVEESMVVLTRFLPRLIGAVIILMLTVGVGRWFSRLLDPYADSRAFPWLPKLTRWIFYVVGAIGALDLVGFRDVTGQLTIAVVATVLLVIVIAWGVGGIAHARTWWDGRAVRSE